MAKSRNQKLKLLYIRDYLLKNSDENHPVTVAQILDHLAANDIEAERKSIYTDLRLLGDYGMDINMVRTKNVGYYVASREFELPELKLLVDSVQSSKFITTKKTLSLIKKLEALTSTYEGSSLQRQVFVHNRVKTMNESVFYNVDAVSNAINEDKAIQFRYYKYKLDKDREFRHDGRYYEISPFALVWDDENYYMMGYDAQADKMKHFRVDKMTSIRITDKTREGKSVFAGTDMSTYNTMVFGMYGGKPEKVTLRFEASLIDPVIDRFGKDIIIIDENNGWFNICVNAQISPQFYAWVFGFGTQCEIVAPDYVKDEMRSLAQKVCEKYN